jgi:predicted aldo/keto reductase-like oxidoreductase
MTKGANNLKRRSFLKIGAAGLAGLCVKPAVSSQQEAPSTAQTTKPQKFIYRTLGKTGIKLPVVSLGVMNSDNPNLVRAALDKGIVLLDTAHSYQRGTNEGMIGEVIKGRPRDSFVIATKIPGDPRDRKTGDFSPETTGEKFLEKFNVSLQRLGLDYVDILNLHNVLKRGQVLYEPLLKALETAKKQGKARFIGVTTHGNEPEVIRAAIESKVHDVVLTAYNFRQDHREEVRKAIAEATQAGLGIIAMKTLAGVYWDKEKQRPINTKAALKWVLNDPNVTTAIPGCTTFDQMDEDLSVMEDLTLTEQEKQDLELEVARGGLYCQGCQMCLSSCKGDLPIPSLMRSYMYAYGYRNLPEAYELLISLSLPEAPCQTCNPCTVWCAKGFDVADRVKDIVRLQNVPAEFLA